jgi:alpha-L-rhamnosidase
MKNIYPLGMSDRTTPDKRRRRYIAPQRLVWQTQGAAAPQDAPALLRNACDQATMWANPGCRLAFNEEPAGLLLDFGAELHGGVQIIAGISPRKRPHRLRIRFGESAGEAMGQPNNDHSLHDAGIEVAANGATEFGATGFRFVRLDAAEPGADVEIKAVRAVSLMREDEAVGSFECSDPLLNRIWETGAYTLRLCLQDYVWDGVKRDRLVWIGDLHPEAVVASAVFGKDAAVERSLDLTRDETPLPRFMNHCVSYSLWWIIIHDHWYRTHGDLDYLKQQGPYLTALLEQMAASIGADGREQLPEWRFLDWPTSDDKAALHAGLQALLCIAMECGARLGAALNANDTVKLCRRAVRALRRPAPPAVDRKQVCALQALAALRDPVTVNEQDLQRDPCRGLSTFYGYYVLQARALANDIDGALETMRRYWGGMLSVGATTFWEHFELDWLEGAGRIDELPQPGRRDIHRDCGAYCFKGWRHSLCHGWAAGPTAWLSEHVLGVRALKPGMRQIALAPRLGSLSWARGTIPTVRGPIQVEHERRADHSIVSRIQLPKGIRQAAGSRS